MKSEGVYLYPYAPVTGNLMYSMSEKGARVKLELLSCREGSAVISACLHWNCREPWEPGERLLCAEYGGFSRQLFIVQWNYLDWRQMALDFGIGVGVDFLMDGVTGFFKGRNAARVVDGITDELSDALGDGAAREMRESMEDIIGDGAERTVRESAEEAAERGTRGITGELMDELDNYERFYDDLFDLQRETFGEYDDFLDDIKELQRGGIDGGNAGNLFEGG